MKIISAPNDWNKSPYPRVFIAGSIEMGKAENWQDRLGRLMADIPGTILNPRRDDWDASWPNSPTQGPLKDQVRWELAARESSDFVLFYFDPSTKSPISLLELGLSANEGEIANDSVVVCCPPGFWRYANVALTCEYYEIPMVADLEALAEWVRTKIKDFLNVA